MALFTTTNDMTGILPDAIETLITTPVMQQSVAAQVARTITTQSTRTHIPLVTGDPTAAWVAEGDEIGASDPTLDDIVVTPAKVAGLTVITNELAADTSPEAADIVGKGLSRDIARKIDAAFFGTNDGGPVQPEGLEDLAGVTDVDAGAAWADMDAFAEALANADALGLQLNSFVANPADALALAKLKDQTGSNRPLLGTDPTVATKRTVLGVRLLVSPAVTEGTVWGIPTERVMLVKRQEVTLDVDTSAYFTSHRTAIRAVMRVGFAFPHAEAIQKLSLSS